MNVYIPLGILLLIATFLFGNNIKQSQKAFFISFLVLFVFSALRYDFGSDYESYAENFSLIKSMGLEGFLDYNHHSEYGFAVFLSWFDSFFVFIIVETFIWLSVFYLFFKNNVPAQYYYVVILMMFFNINFNLLNYTAIRSSLAGCFFFVGLGILMSSETNGLFGGTWGKRFILHSNKLNLLLYLVLVYFGSLFHTSILFFLIFPFITSSKNISKSLAQVLFVIGIVLAVLSVMFRTTFSLSLSLWIIDLFPSSFDRYTDYLDMLNTGGGGFGALLFNVMRLLILYPILQALTIEKEPKCRRLMQLAIVFIYIFFLINENLLSRFTMCFYPIIMVALLRSFKYAKPNVRLIGLWCLVLLSLFQFYIHYTGPYFRSFLHYQTIFSAPSWQ